MMSFWALSLRQKTLFGAFPTSPMSFLQCFPLTFGSKTLVPTMFLNIYLLMSFDIASNAFNSQHLGTPYCSKKKHHVQLSTTSVL